ncbi:MAG: hypothetical protein ACOYT7_00830 [Patescibacteria group bacterium]
MEDVLNNLGRVFPDQSFSHQEAINVKGGGASSIFIGNGGQVFDTQIFKEEAVDTAPLLIIQPAIRLQGRVLVGELDGFTTSFVNIATEQLEATVNQHTVIVDRWMDFLSKNGLYLADFTLKPKLEQASWGNVSGVKIYTLKFNYKGLELGVANFAQIPQKTRPTLTQSDITFGLERIIWAINKNSRYYEIIGPVLNALRGEDIVMDAYRTSTLITASGVHPGVDEQGSKLRGLIQRYSTLEQDFNPDIVRYYYNWWSKFARFPLEINETVHLLRSESERMRNIQITQILQENGVSGLPPASKTHPTEKLISGLSSDEIDILRRKMTNN